MNKFCFENSTQSLARVRCYADDSEILSVLTVNRDCWQLDLDKITIKINFSNVICQCSQSVTTGSAILSGLTVRSECIQ